MFRKCECWSVARCLWDYATGRLPECEIERVERHLQRCPSCRTESEKYAQAVQLLAAYREHPVPESRVTWYDLRSRLAVERRPAVAVPSPAWGAAVFAGLMLMVIVGGIWRGLGRSSPPPPLIPGVKYAVHPNASTGGARSQAKGTPIDDGQNAPPAVPGDGGRSETRGTSNPKPTDLLPDGQTGDTPKQHRKRVRRHPMFQQVPFERRPAPRSEPNQTRLTDYAASVDGPATGAPKRDFVIGPAGLPANPGPARHYVMDSIPVSSHNIRQASFQQGAGETEAW